jgi:hypothetical protein
MCGEASTTYTFFPQYRQTAHRLYHYNPNLKLIYLMRNPVERMISQYTHEYLRGKIRTNLEDELLGNPTYINRSRYGVQVRWYLEYFPRDQLLLMTSEELKKCTSRSVERVIDFLGLPPYDCLSDVDLKHKNVSAKKRVLKRLPKRLKKYLPEKIRTPVGNAAKFWLLPVIYRRTVTKPAMDPKLYAVLWNMLEDDVRFIEGLMSRTLSEWRQHESAEKGGP